MFLKIHLIVLIFFAHSTLASTFTVGEGNKSFKTLPSSYKDVYLGNLHAVNEEKTIFRGASPEKFSGELKKLGIQKILIVKSQSKNEVNIELENLKKLGYTDEDIKWVALPWKEERNTKKVCLQTVEALQFLDEQTKLKNKTFFHCTVGEDRTGLIAGLYRIHQNKWSVSEALNKEMCPRGYAHANQRKPKWVSDEVEATLTPVFNHLAFELQTKKLSPELCNTQIKPVGAQSCPTGIVTTE